jgi:hypothetical protein
VQIDAQNPGAAMANTYSPPVVPAGSVGSTPSVTPAGNGGLGMHDIDLGDAGSDLSDHDSYHENDPRYNNSELYLEVHSKHQNNSKSTAGRRRDIIIVRYNNSELSYPSCHDIQHLMASYYYRTGIIRKRSTL